MNVKDYRAVLTIYPLIMGSLGTFDQVMATLNKIKCLVCLGRAEDAFASISCALSLIKMNASTEELKSFRLEIYTGIFVTIETMIETDGTEKIIELMECLLSVVTQYFVGSQGINMVCNIIGILTKIITRLWWQNKTEQIRAYYVIMDQLLNTVESSAGIESTFRSIAIISAVQCLSSCYMKAKDWKKVCDVNKLSQNVIKKELGADAALSFMLGDCYSNIAIACAKLLLQDESEIAQNNAVFVYENANDWRDQIHKKIILGKTSFNFYHLKERRFTESLERNIRKLSSEWQPVASSDPGVSFRPIAMH